jgi:hypothetical protein
LILKRADKCEEAIRRSRGWIATKPNGFIPLGSNPRG